MLCRPPPARRRSLIPSRTTRNVASAGRTIRAESMHRGPGRPGLGRTFSTQSRPLWAPNSKPLIVLGIETSCDDTGVAIVSSHKQVLADVLIRQDHIHSTYRGIVPPLAAAGHRERLEEALSASLDQAKLTWKDISAIAFTQGPGLSACLQVGLDAARKLHRETLLPIVGVNHMEGHALVARLNSDQINFPFLALLVSGGHSLIVVCRGVGNYCLLGQTLDIALGSCYDKVGRVLGTEFQGGSGRFIEDLAKAGDPRAFELPVPLATVRNCDMSFSGIEEATKKLVRAEPERFKEQSAQANLAASFQSAAIGHVTSKVAKAIQWCRINQPEVKQLVVSGGVACNQYLRNQLKPIADPFQIQVIAPPPKLCTDNGVMIAWAGIEQISHGKSPFVSDIFSAQYHTRWPMDTSNTEYFPDSHFSHASSSTQADLSREFERVQENFKKTVDTNQVPKEEQYYKLAKAAFRLKNFPESKRVVLKGLEAYPASEYLRKLEKRLPA